MSDKVIDWDVITKQYPGLATTIKTGKESHDGREEGLLAFIESHQQLDEIKGSPEKMLATMDEYSRNTDFLISIGPHKSGVLVDLLEKEEPKVIVELGGYLGYSAILFANTLREMHGADAEFHVWSLELDPKFASIADKLIEIAGLSKYISVVVGPAEENLKKLLDKSDISKIDLLFLDHVEKLYQEHFELCRSLGLFKEGTVIAADNVVRPGAPEYRTFVRADPSLSSIGIEGLIQPGDLYDEIEITHVQSV
ncbi:S-adenosyl-L-methionine-dependent methyltransferase [Microthyrium microscopicum]|uniref:catechol O-methyltransferase n=1 Tax=Microthyrium microscopicum TaxID=703497 RepID=A0A6A6TYR6_9PEZI|nr:S-adenosyl-L-methionine-dependent methyltransferase [Microthyrium microscopicum]